jgi:hypothetical protein
MFDADETDNVPIVPDAALPEVTNDILGETDPLVAEDALPVEPNVIVFVKVFNVADEALPEVANNMLGETDPLVADADTPVAATVTLVATDAVTDPIVAADVTPDSPMVRAINVDPIRPAAVDPVREAVLPPPPLDTAKSNDIY